MRLRIQTFPPLPDLKAWFSLEVHHTPNTIRGLKELLCSNITVLKEACIHAREIQLLLDDFELLNESSFTATLRDGDLLCVKAQISAPQRPKFEDKGIQELPSQRKRKRARKQDKANKKQKKSKEKSEGSNSSTSSLSNSSSSRSSSPSSSSSSPSSSSSSTSSLSSSEDSDSDSDSSSPPSPQPSEPLKTLHHPRAPQDTVSTSPATKAIPAPEGPFVPPGYGKATTHARNLRRKRLRAAQAQHRAESALQETQAFQIPPNLLSQPNAIPLGEKHSSRTPSSIKDNSKEKSTMMIVDEGVRAEEGVEGGQEVMMASLGNKNKKKGYKQFLMAPVPKKIVFTEDGQPAASDSTLILPPIVQPSTSRLRMPKIVSSASSKTQKLRPRLIPPSEIQERGELPPNMFVTSVDVEADLWDSSGKRKRKNQNKMKNFSCGYDDSSIGENEYLAEEDITLPYGDEGDEGSVEEILADTQPADQEVSVVPAFDWNQGERLFENAPKVSQANDLRTGQIVGWKSLDLNPQTFTPEILLIAAKVVEYSDGISAKIQRFVRPIDPEFSGFLALTDDEESRGVAAEVEEYQWADILAADWRILQFP